MKVELGDTYQPDPAFLKLQKSLADIAAKKDLQALTALVGSSFVWVTAGEVSESFDFGGDPVQNFKVVFGFRDYRKYVDGGVPATALIDSLAAFAADKSYKQSAETLGLHQSTNRQLRRRQYLRKRQAENRRGYIRPSGISPSRTPTSPPTRPAEHRSGASTRSLFRFSIPIRAFRKDNPARRPPT